MRLKNSFLLTFIFCLIWATGFSQEKLQLKTVLQNIEKQHEVKFSFIDETVANKMVTTPEKTVSLIDKLEELQQQLSIAFEIINGKYIIISNAKQSAANENRMVFELSEVVIDHYLTSGISKRNGGNFVIKPDKFGILPGLTEPDVLQTMQQIPGIYSADESISNINVRGGTHDQNLFLWNGIRMFQTGHFFGLISAFNPSLPNRISISKNGSSAFFGESVSSVVDISTQSDGIENSENSIGLNLISAEFYSKTKISDKSSFLVSGRRSFTDAFSSPTYQKYYNCIFQNTLVTDLNNNQIIDYKTDENFFFYDFTAQYQQEIGTKNELFVDMILISNELGIRQNASIDNEFQSRYSSLQQQNFGGSLSWKTNWNDHHDTKIIGYMSRYNLDASNESIENRQLLKQQNTVLDTGLKIENHYKVNARVNLNGGYHYNETGISNNDAVNDPFYSRRIKEVLRSHALIAETEYVSAGNKTFFKGGIRANYLEKFNKVLIEPRLQFSFALTNLLRLELLGERKSQTMSQIIDLQRDFLGIEKRRWTLANDGSIPIQKSSQLSIGLAFNNKKWLCTIDNFYKKVDGISSPGQAFRNQLETMKINGDYTVLGSEILLQRNFTNFCAWLGYSFNRNEYDFAAFNPKQFPNNFEIEHNISFAAVYDQHKLKLALGGKWHSGRPTTKPFEISEQEIRYFDPNGNNLNAFLQFNFSASYYWKLGKKSKLQLNGSVLNLFNNRNTISRYYRVNTQSNSIESVNTYALERTPNLSVKFTI